MNDDPKRPILLILTSHWISMLGVALVTLAGLSWLSVLPASAARREGPEVMVWVTASK